MGQTSPMIDFLCRHILELMKATSCQSATCRQKNEEKRLLTESQMRDLCVILPFYRSHCDHLKTAEVRVLLHQAQGDLPCWHQTMKQRISPKRHSAMEQQNGARGNSRHNVLQIWESSFVTPHSKQRSEQGDQHQDDTERISKN